MKNLFLTITMTAISLVSQSFTTPLKTANTVREEVILQAGTPISLTLNQSLNSDEVEVGNTVLMIVDDAVVAENQIVIRKGERAEGTVTYIKREDKCSTCPDKFQRIEITVTRVKAIDGQQIWLYGKPFSARGKCAKCPIELNVTTRLEATVQQNTRVVVR